MCLWAQGQAPRRRGSRGSAARAGRCDTARVVRRRRKRRRKGRRHAAFTSLPVSAPLPAMRAWRGSSPTSSPMMRAGCSRLAPSWLTPQLTATLADPPRGNRPWPPPRRDKAASSRRTSRRCPCPSRPGWPASPSASTRPCITSLKGSQSRWCSTSPRRSSTRCSSGSPAGAPRRGCPTPPRLLSAGTRFPWAPSPSTRGTSPMSCRSSRSSTHQSCPWSSRAASPRAGTAPTSPGGAPGQRRRVLPPCPPRSSHPCGPRSCRPSSKWVRIVSPSTRPVPGSPVPPPAPPRGVAKSLQGPWIPWCGW
ncbi:hypothetical protein A306_00012175 [Columba livia]|uniref:Uncharacterized protein n=1 Tax=Columba livia TaxID=8932 RepID=A0A2I0LTC6_COLLI|nr:hypothetical protein A306_00012175 [Columba livia]